MKRMLRITLLALLMCVSTVAFAQKKPVEIGKKEFLSKIANYEKDSLSWNYLGDKPAIVDFYADWCKPCKLVEKPLQELAREYAGKIYVYKVNVDKHKELAKEIGINSIPTIIFAPMGKDPQILTGAMGKEALKSYIETVLLGNESSANADGEHASGVQSK